jgi:hypothetical protein
MNVKLVETENQRRLHIGSYFTDLNENEYQELVRIFSAGVQSQADKLAEAVIHHLGTKTIQDRLDSTANLRQALSTYTQSNGANDNNLSKEE